LAVPKPVQPGRAAQQPAKPDPPAATGAVVGPPELPRDARLTPAEDQETNRIEKLVEAATRTLDRTDASRLSVGNKEQYDDARRFLQDATKALKERRFSYAIVNAEKAMTIATQLAPIAPK
jgi:hypothetical protein